MSILAADLPISIHEPVGILPPVKPTTEPDEVQKAAAMLRRTIPGLNFYQFTQGRQWNHHSDDQVMGTEVWTVAFRAVNGTFYRATEKTPSDAAAKAAMQYIEECRQQREETRRAAWDQVNAPERHDGGMI